MTQKLRLEIGGSDSLTGTKIGQYLVKTSDSVFESKVKYEWHEENMFTFIGKVQMS